eukprot:74236_1
MEPMDTVERINNQRENSIFSNLESISTTEDGQILPYLDCIGIENLKIYIAQSLGHQISNNTSILNSLYFKIESLENILCTDILVQIISHLHPIDISRIYTLNKTFNQLLKKRTTVHRLFYYHPMLRQLFDKWEWSSRDAYKTAIFGGSKLQYTLQNKYDTAILNACTKSTDKLLQTLIGHDLYICRLFRYFDLNIILRGEIGPGDTDIDNCYTECFEDIFVEIESLPSSNWGVTYLNESINEDGQDDIEMIAYYRHHRWHHGIIPTLLIDVPDTKVRNKIEKSIGQNKTRMSSNEDEEEDMFGPIDGKEAIQELGMWF